MLTLFFKDDPSLRRAHAYFGSAILFLSTLHMGFGVLLAVSFNVEYLESCKSHFARRTTGFSTTGLFMSHVCQLSASFKESELEVRLVPR